MERKIELLSEVKELVESMHKDDKFDNIDNVYIEIGDFGDGYYHAMFMNKGTNNMLGESCFTGIQGREKVKEIAKIMSELSGVNSVKIAKLKHLDYDEM